MIRETEQPAWEEVRGKIKSRFGKLSESQIDGLKGHMDQLTPTIKKAYSYDQSRAEQECKSFNETIKPVNKDGKITSI